MRWWWGGGQPHPHPTHPYVIRSCELSEMSNEEGGHPTPTYPPYVIRSCELSEMSNEKQDTTPHPTHPMSLGIVS